MPLDKPFLDAIGPWLELSGPGPVGVRISLAIRQAISNGQLADGTRLPPERELASQLFVSRPTISAVIDDLRSGGLAQSRQGSGTWITAPPLTSVPAIPFAERVQVAGQIDLASATAPDASLLPSMRVETSDLISSEPANGLTPLGLPGLRAIIAARYQRWWSESCADGVVVTSGAHQALALVTAALAPAGSTILVEAETYGGYIDIARARGCTVVAIERDTNGPIPERLAELVQRHQPALIVIVASVHSPTGSVSSRSRSSQLAEVLSDAPCAVVVDETYADLAFVPDNRDLSRALGAKAIRIGSLSKSLWTGLRTGWIVTNPEIAADIGRCRWSQFDLGPSIPAQLFALQAIQDIDELMETRVPRLRKSAQHICDLIETRLPAWVVAPIQGGLAAWIDISATGLDGATFAQRAGECGVAVLPGSASCIGTVGDQHIRICFDRPQDVLDDAVERLAQVSARQLV